MGTPWALHSSGHFTSTIPRHCTGLSCVFHSLQGGISAETSAATLSPFLSYRVRSSGALPVVMVSCSCVRVWWQCHVASARYGCDVYLQNPTESHSTAQSLHSKSLGDGRSCLSSQTLLDRSQIIKGERLLLRGSRGGMCNSKNKTSRIKCNQLDGGNKNERTNPPHFAQKRSSNSKPAPSKSQTFRERSSRRGQ